MIDVVICTHNPRTDFLERTVQSLQKQTLPHEQWTFTIVDNSSNPPVDAKYVSWHPSGSVCIETKLGLTSARVCGIQNTAGELIVFVDDDNVLAANYLQETIRVAQDYPFLGAFGSSQIIPEFEQEPSSEIRKHVRKLALRDLKTSIWSNDPRDGSDPWGAGLVVRRDVANAFVELVLRDPTRLELGRQGENLNSGEDNEFSWLSCELGYGKGVFSTLSMKHLMSVGRVEPNYIIRISEGHSFSRTLTSYLHQSDFRKYDDQFGRKFSFVPKMTFSTKIKHFVARVMAVFPGTFHHKVRYASYCGFARAVDHIEKLSAKNSQASDS